MISSNLQNLINATAPRLTQAKAMASHNDPISFDNQSVVHVLMMDPDIGKYRHNLSDGAESSLTECIVREEYSSLYLTMLIILVTVGLTASLFVLTVIGWFPDLYSTSKYIGQVTLHSRKY